MLSFLLASSMVLAQGRPQAPPPRLPEPPEKEKLEEPSLPLTSPSKLLKYHHEEVIKEMAKLAKLVEEVQQELDKAGENVLPLNSLRKLEEVERLSRKIRSRLKQ